MKVGDTINNATIVDIGEGDYFYPLIDGFLGQTGKFYVTGVHANGYCDGDFYYDLSDRSDYFAQIKVAVFKEK